MLKVYCDANIFIDYFGKRTDGLRPLDEFAWAFFSKGWNCAFHLIVSDWLITELRKHLREEKINEVIAIYKNKGKLIFVKEGPGDREKAGSISQHWQDPLH